MKKLVVVLAVLVGLVVLLVGAITYDAGSFDFKRLSGASLAARFNKLVGPHHPGILDPYQPDTTEWGIRWFPTHVNFGPDNDTLLVSLCHVQRPGYCRIGKYRISDKHWDVLPFEDKRTYLNPIFSPDGQWIVLSSGPCDEQRRCDARDFQIMKMPPDGSKMELVADSSASAMSFAHNGKKLIYWRLRVIVTPGEPKYAAAVDLYQLDWETGKESPLVDVGFMGEQWGQPVFTPDGEYFIFSSNPRVFQTSNEPAFGPDNPNASLFIVATKDAPINKQNYREAIHPMALPGPYVIDIDRQGRILYSGDIASKRKAGNPAAMAIRPPNPDFSDDSARAMEQHRALEERMKTSLSDDDYRRGEGTLLFFRQQQRDLYFLRGEGTALFLRKPDASAQDEAAFDAHYTCTASVSPDSARIAFLWGSCRSAMPETAIGLIGLGQSMKDTTFLDWPKLDLIPTPPLKP